MQKKRKQVFLFISGTILLGGVAFVIGRHIIKSRPFYFAGTLDAQRIIITARVPSDIADIFVADGDTVVASQPLLELSCDGQKILARQLDNDFNRATALMERGHVSVAEMDVITRNKQDNDMRLGWCNVTSPIDGVITSKLRNVGEIVAPGMPLFVITDPYDIHAYFYVPYEMLARVGVGDRVRGILPELPGREFTGRIVKINDVAEFTPKNVQTRDARTRLVYGIKVQFENPDLVLKSGMTIESTLNQ